MTCPDCTYQWVPAKSKRLIVCPNCAHKEAKGEYLVDYKKRRAKESLIASQLRAKAKMALNPKKKYVIPQQSTKGAKQAREVTKVKHEAKEAALDGGFVECRGCGMFFDVIDYSHTVSVAQSKSMASMRGNGSLLCRGCHTAWESNDATQMIELNCFFDDMHWLLDMDPERFWKRFHKLTDEYELRPTQKLGAIISRLEKLE